jgi:TonB family protein
MTTWFIIMGNKVLKLLGGLLLLSGLCTADPRFASLKVTSRPKGCSISLNGKTHGTTPLTLQLIEPGENLLVLTHKGYHEYSKKLAFEGGKKIVCKAVLDTLSTAEADSLRKIEESHRRSVDTADSASKDKYVAVDSVPRILRKIQPMYPLEAKELYIDGKVYVQILIDTTGSVVRADVAKSSGIKPLDDAAVEAAQQWTFTPAIAPGNKKVRVWVMQAFTFKLH